MPGSAQVTEAPFALMTFDARGTVVDANRRAVSLLGTRRVDLIGTNADDFDWLVLESPDGPISVHPVTAAVKTGQPVTGVLVRARRPSAPDLWLQVDAMPMAGADGDVAEVALTITDVTHLFARSALSPRTAGDHIISEVVNELAEVRLQSRAVLFAVTRALARARSGTWVASLMDKDPRTSQPVAADGTNPELVQYLQRYLDTQENPGHATTGPITSRLVETGEAMLVKRRPIEDLWSADPELAAYIAQHPIPMEVGMVNMLAVPMRARGVVIGMLALYERQTSNPLSEKDIEWMQAVADRTAVAIENAQLYEDAVRRLERLTSLQNLSMALSASPDLRLTLKVILDQVVTQLKVDAADVLLLDESDNMLTLAANTGFFATAVPDYRLPLEEGMPGQAAASRRIVTITALGAYSQVRRRSLFAREGFKAYGAVPLVTRGKLLGALEVFHRTPLAPDPEWNSFLEALGSVAAIAIDSASLQDRLRRAPVAPTRIATSAPSGLSRLEVQILRLVVEGLTNREIAAEVHLSQNTVKFHMRQLLQKTQTSNRTELAHRAAKEGWF